MPPSFGTNLPQTVTHIWQKAFFKHALGLSGTYLAKNDDEKRIIVWLLEKDQRAIGSGLVGFDICEMPWNVTNFNEMKCFLLNVIEGQKRELGGNLWAINLTKNSYSPA